MVQKFVDIFNKLFSDIKVNFKKLIVQDENKEDEKQKAIENEQVIKALQSEKDTNLKKIEELESESEKLKE